MGPKHRRDGIFPQDVDRLSRARCDNRPACPACHPGYYAETRARHRDWSVRL